MEALLPYSRAELVAQVHREGEVLKREDREEGTWLLANVGRSTFDALRPFALSDPWADEREGEG